MGRHNVFRDPLVHDWLSYIQRVNLTRQRVLKDCEEFCIPFMAIPMPIIKTVFMICDYFEFAPNTRYIAVYLYDKFMCEHFWEVYNNNGKTCPDTGTWSQVCQRISGQAQLRLMSCVQIASKMDSHSKGLSITQVIAALRKLDEKHTYTPTTVFSSEFKVFKTVGFKVPLATALDCIEVLIAAAGLDESKQLHQAAIHLLDLSYLQHYQLYSHLQFVALGRAAKSEEEKKNAMAMEANVLYLGASIVLCATFMFNFEKEYIIEIAEKLSDLVDVEKNDIWTMANILFTMGSQKAMITVQ